MKQFMTVLKFELEGYFKNKTYMITSIGFSLLLIIGLSIPSFVDCSGIIPGLKNEDTQKEEVQKEDVDITKLALYSKDVKFSDNEIMDEIFQDTEWTIAYSKEEVEKLVQSDKVSAGFVVNGPKEFEYVIVNSGFSDNNSVRFQTLLQEMNRKNYCEENNIDYAEIGAVYNTPINFTETILGKDSINSYWYTYFLIIILYMVVVLYGQMIAVSVTNEKSNRAIEVLVTSTSSNSLIFGKVIAGAIASTLQIGIILTSGLLSYQVNQGVWNGMLDVAFHIPLNVLITFAIFGIFGYLFYAFIFGALGALVSKTEDVSQVSGPVMMIFMVVYMAVLFQLTNPDGMVMKVLAFLPFSSPEAMFIRVAMGKVELWEIIVSFIILIVSATLVGIGGAKIYRRGTLNYGNPVKLRNALKWLSKTE